MIVFMLFSLCCLDTIIIIVIVIIYYYWDYSVTSYSAPQSVLATKLQTVAGQRCLESGAGAWWFWITTATFPLHISICRSIAATHQTLYVSFCWHKLLMRIPFPSTRQVCTRLSDHATACWSQNSFSQEYQTNAGHHEAQARQSRVQNWSRFEVTSFRGRSCRLFQRSC